MKTFWRVLAVLVVFPAVSWAQIGKITSPSSGATPDVVFASTACTSAVGTDAYACSPATTPCPAALANGQYVFLTTDVANTGAATFAYCGLAAKAIVWPSPTASVALATGDMLANVGYLLQYNATGDNWKLGFSSNTPSVAANNTWTGTQTLNSTLSAAALTASSGSITITPSDQGLIMGTASTLGGIYRLTASNITALATGTTNNAWHVEEFADTGFPFANGPCGASTCTDPQLIVHTSAQDTTQFVGYSAVGASGGAVKTLTESSATTVFGCPSAALHSLGCEVRYHVEACDATDCQTRSGRNFISGTNKAGTMTCAVAAASEAADGSTYVSSTGAGTLTYAATATTGTAECIFNLNAVASLTQTSLFVQYQVNNLGPGQVTRK